MKAFFTVMSLLPHVIKLAMKIMEYMEREEKKKLARKVKKDELKRISAILERASSSGNLNELYAYLSMPVHGVEVDGKGHKEESVS